MAVCLSDEADTKRPFVFGYLTTESVSGTSMKLPGRQHLCYGRTYLFQYGAGWNFWSIPANYETYELLYRTQPLSKTDNANTPMTFKVGKTYASIHEAALTDFPEMTLQNTGGCGSNRVGSMARRH